MKILGRIPKNHFHVSVSGGSDSMTLVDFLRRFPKNQFDVLYFNHGTEHGMEAEEFLRRKCKEFHLELRVGRLFGARVKQSEEEFWRVKRYEFLEKFSDEPILMAHHLNDVLETYVMTAMKGNPKLIPYHNSKYNIFRPLLLVKKSEINEWILKNKVEFIQDMSNFDEVHDRNFIRGSMMDSILRLNPGIYKTLRKLVMTDFNGQMI